MGVDFLVYGYSGDTRSPSLFEINGKGRIIDHMALGYAVTGSGYWMSSASLRRKPLDIDFESRLYRLLEAKFSAETASGVGRKATTVTFKRQDQHDYILPQEIVEKFRTIWDAKMREPEPLDALKIAGEAKMVMMRADQLRSKSSGS